MARREIEIERIRERETETEKERYISHCATSGIIDQDEKIL